MKHLNMAVLLAFFMSATLLARYGQPGNKGGGNPEMYMGRHHEAMGAKMDKIMDELKLDEAKKVKIKDINTKHREKMEELRKKMETIMDSTHAEIEKTETNEGEIKKLKDEHKKIMSEIIDTRVDHILAVKKELTPDQFRELQDKMKKSFRMGKRGRPEGKGMMRKWKK
ncbi:MAG: Spy/CpxP family protein refolding chaperone [Oligoflexia bacterium]|nr:Spy/CpxP family protein refolding chaperone [Oligoflexia bacterium]